MPLNVLRAAYILRLLLLGCILIMIVLAAFFLRTRDLTLIESIGWGVMALILPVLGPFLVIWIRPGRSKEAS